ncbi:antibiotic biosynthesis monooxygenase family protein [Enterococcus sp. HY326]|uniref:antibiotic biosynthesis monooxygenase family protein n=1 Tax=Enterococcus sp. HY326 TaxID=2971265 RepID=UPI00223FA3C0|nr:hypothetical protein [Enterococcus sp. HY326]
MSKIVFFNSYKLKKDVDISEFLLAVENLNENHISKQQGYISFEVFSDNDTWADATTFETMEDAKNFTKVVDKSGTAKKFYSFLNLNSCKSNFYKTEKCFFSSKPN